MSYQSFPNNPLSDGYYLTFKTSDGYWSGQNISGIIYDTFSNIKAQTNKTIGIPSDGGRMLVYDGSTWRPIVGNTVGKEPPGALSFTSFNSGSVTKANGILKCTPGVTSQWSGAGIQYSSSGLGTPTIIGRVQLNNNTSIYSPTSKHYSASIYIREAATGKLALTGWTAFLNGSSLQFQGPSYSKASSPSVDVDASFYDGGTTGVMWLRVRVSGGVVSHDFSFDRVTWVNMPITTSTSTTSYFTTPGSGNYEYGVAVWSENVGTVSFFDDLEQS